MGGEVGTGGRRRDPRRRTGRGGREESRGQRKLGGERGLGDKGRGRCGGAPEGRSGARRQGVGSRPSGRRGRKSAGAESTRLALGWGNVGARPRERMASRTRASRRPACGTGALAGASSRGGRDRGAPEGRSDGGSRGEGRRPRVCREAPRHGRRGGRSNLLGSAVSHTRHGGTAGTDGRSRMESRGCRKVLKRRSRTGWDIFWLDWLKQVEPGELEKRLYVPVGCGSRLPPPHGHASS